LQFIAPFERSTPKSIYRSFFHGVNKEVFLYKFISLFCGNP